MVDDKQINRWLKEGTITGAQAKKMLASSAEYREETRSNKLIVVLSVIGALLLGIGAILFIASNWQVIPRILKVVILVGATFGALYIGYLFRYQKKNLPKVGSALFFLGALLFGATIMLLAQMYNVNANANVLVLIWLLGILPLVYAFASQPIAVLSSILFYIWFWFFLDFRFNENIIPLYLVAGLFLFSVGGVHYFSERLHGVGRMFRLSGLKVAVLALFFLTFQDIVRSRGSTAGMTTLVTFSVVVIIITAFNFFLNKETSILENSASLLLTGLVLIFSFFPSTTSIYSIIFNIVLAGLILAILFVGHKREDMTLVNTGLFYLAALVIVRYFDFFWALLPRSIFFMVGGLILLFGGIALEKKRRDFKKEFAV